jgi:Raf kinase inhibitor-like YbhB/YbcL family protein
MRSRLFSSTLAAAVAVALSVTLAAQAPQGAGAPGAQGGGQGRGGGGRGGGRGMVPMLLESDAYADGAIVPAKYSNAGGSTIPGFKISNVPEGTVSFAVIFHDIEPNIGNPPNDVLHAMFWNVPAASNGWSEGPSDGSKMPAGTVMGFNIQKKPVYMGPGAPAGPRYHHYIFEVYALNANLDLPPDSTREAVYAAMAGKVVGKAAYVGRFRGEPK